MKLHVLFYNETFKAYLCSLENILREAVVCTLPNDPRCQVLLVLPNEKILACLSHWTMTTAVTDTQAKGNRVSFGV